MGREAADDALVYGWQPWERIGNDQPCRIFQSGSVQEFGPGGVFIIDTAAIRLRGRIDGEWTEHPEIELSQDGSLTYLNQRHSGEILVIDLSQADVIRTNQGPPQFTVLDEGILIVTFVP